MSFEGVRQTTGGLAAVLLARSKVALPVRWYASRERAARHRRLQKKAIKAVPARRLFRTGSHFPQACTKIVAPFPQTKFFITVIRLGLSCT